MKQSLVLIFFSFQFIFAFSQTNENLEKELDSIQNTNSQVDHINYWAFKNYKKKPKQADYYLEKSLQLAKSTQYNKGIGIALMRIGVAEKRRGNYSESLKCYNESIDYLSMVNDSTELFKALTNRSLVQIKLHHYDDALKSLFKCIQYAERKNELKLLMASHNNSGLVYKNIKNYDKALVHYNNAAHLAVKNGNLSFLYNTNNNIANIHSIKGNFKAAMEHYQKNLNILNKKPNKYRKAQTLHNLGNTFMFLNQYDLALEYFKQSLHLKEQIGNINLITTTINSIAHSYYRQSNYSEALKYSNKAYQIALKSKNIAYQRTSSKDLFKTYTRLNRPDSAITYFNIYETLKDSLLNKENLKQIAEIETKYETEKKEAQIALLEKENRIKKMQRNVLTVLAILLLCFLAFVLRSFFKNKKVTRLLRLQKMRIEWHRELLHQRNQALQQSNQTKNKLFQIISHDLRSPLASVSGIAKLIPMFIKKERYDILPSTSQDLEESVSRVLNLTDNLLCWSMNQSGRLPHNPEIICVHKIVASNMDTYLSVAKQKNIHLEMWTAQNIFVYADRYMLETVMRNLINNAIKFTPDGGVILIDAKQTVEHTEIRVKDSGVGIPADKIPKLFEVGNNKSNIGTRGEAGNGLGLILCKDFVERNNGTIWAESTEGMGATFHFTVPNAEKIAETDAVQMKMDLGK